MLKISAIEIDKDKRLGWPCIKGTRIAVAELIAEIAIGTRSLQTLCEDYDTDFAAAQAAFYEVASYFSRPLPTDEMLKASNCKYCRGETPYYPSVQLAEGNAWVHHPPTTVMPRVVCEDQKHWHNTGHNIKHGLGLAHG